MDKSSPINPNKIIAKLIDQGANQNLQIVSLTVALEEALDKLKEYEDGEKDGNVKQAE